MVDVQTFLEALFNMLLRSFYFTDEAFFSGKKSPFHSWDYSPPVPDYQNSLIVGHQIKEFCCLRYFSILVVITWGPLMVAQWLRYCATYRKVAGSIPDGVIGIFH
jgi:hypothetical protein